MTGRSVCFSSTPRGSLLLVFDALSDIVDSPSTSTWVLRAVGCNFVAAQGSTAHSTTTSIETPMRLRGVYWKHYCYLRAQHDHDHSPQKCNLESCGSDNLCRLSLLWRISSCRLKFRAWGTFWSLTMESLQLAAGDLTPQVGGPYAGRVWFSGVIAGDAEYLP